MRIGLGSQGSNSRFPADQDAVDPQFDFIIRHTYVNLFKLTLLTGECPAIRYDKISRAKTGSGI